MTGFNIWQFLGGVAVFVFAMGLIESSLKNLAGRSFKKFLQKNSQSKIKMTASTMVVTGLLQSSSIVLLIILSFVGAGFINLQGALAATLGANIGTTLDSWLVALVGFKLNLIEFAFPLLGFSLIGMLLFSKNAKVMHFTRFVIGLSLIFIALEWLKDCVDNSMAEKLASFTDLHYAFFIPIGFLLTAVIQSSSATVAITLSALYNHILPFESACGIVIGSELGTTVKFLIGSIGGIADKRRVAWGNFIINFTTMIIAAIILHPLIYLIHLVIAVGDPFVSLVLFQSGINVISTLIFYPFLSTLAGYLEKNIGHKEEQNLTIYIHNKVTALPGDALDLSKKEIIHLMNETVSLNRLILGITNNHDQKKKKPFKAFISGAYTFEQNYERIKMLHGEILEYLSELSKEDMNNVEIEQTGKQISIVRHLLRSTKNLKDIKHNLDDFDSSVNDEIFELSNTIKNRAKSFYAEFEHLLSGEPELSTDKINALFDINRKQYDLAIAATLNKLKENKFSELDSSNIINVYREIYSSDKALISSLRDLEGIDEETTV